MHLLVLILTLAMQLFTHSSIFAMDFTRVAQRLKTRQSERQVGQEYRDIIAESINDIRGALNKVNKDLRNPDFTNDQARLNERKKKLEADLSNFLSKQARQHADLQEIQNQILNNRIKQYQK